MRSDYQRHGNGSSDHFNQNNGYHYGLRKVLIPLRETGHNEAQGNPFGNYLYADQYLYYVPPGHEAVDADADKYKDSHHIELPQVHLGHFSFTNVRMPKTPAVMMKI
jgi:hypothetical protein